MLDSQNSWKVEGVRVVDGTEQAKLIYSHWAIQTLQLFLVVITNFSTSTVR